MLPSQDQKCVLWGHSDVDLWPSKSNQVMYESNTTLLPNLRKVPQGVLEILCSQLHIIPAANGCHHQEGGVKNKGDKSDKYLWESKAKSLSFLFLIFKNYLRYNMNGTLVERIDLEHCALLVEIELDPWGQLLLLGGQVLCEGGGQPDGALRDGGVCSHAPPRPGIPTDLQHTERHRLNKQVLITVDVFSPLLIWGNSWK